jgi:hypothetical protein
MTNFDASPVEVTSVAAQGQQACLRDRDVLLSPLPVAGGLLPLVLLGLAL